MVSRLKGMAWRGPLRPPVAAASETGRVEDLVEKASVVCWCGKDKRPGRWLCWDCWTDLLPTMQFDVQKGKVEEALQWLRTRAAARKEFQGLFK